MRVCHARTGEHGNEVIVATEYTMMSILRLFIVYHDRDSFLYKTRQRVVCIA
jgi:hypothetical protein